jgi:hypothetical protein
MVRYKGDDVKKEPDFIPVCKSQNVDSLMITGSS